MTSIHRISKLKHPGTLRDFTWPPDLIQFGCYNLIYGWNGTGKTTISKLFRALETRTIPPDCEVVLEINGAKVRGQDFEDTTLSIRVFNRDFVSVNVFPTNGDLSPIFVLGEDSVQKQKELDGLKNDLADAERELLDIQSKRDNAVTNLDTYCIDQARVIKETLRSSDSRNQYNNYNKSDFRNRAEEMSAAGDAMRHQLEDSAREKFLMRRLEQPKRKINELIYRLPSLSTYTREVSQLLETTVVSMAIDSLKNNQALSTWMRTGLGLHRSHQASQCLFCEQPLPEGRIQRLSDHFNTEYEIFLSNIVKQIKVLEDAWTETEALEVPHESELYEELVESYVPTRDELTKARKAVTTTLDSLVKELENKRLQPFEKVVSDVLVPEIASDAVENLNQVVKQHNAVSEEFENRVVESRHCLEADSIAGSLEEFTRRKLAKDKYTAAADQASTDFRSLQADISRLEQGIMEHRRPAEELNRDLQKYLGHSDLQLTVKDTGYQITRNDTLAYALSEGEMTAIALLYFLRTLEDNRFELRKGVVVLDDPVSSLDANALYLAFGYIKERTQESGQLFILTHNLTLFRQVKNWFHHLQGQNKSNPDKRPAKFYMLEWNFKDEQRTSTLRPLDPLLHEYESDYHYLFARIYREAQSGPRVGLEENYVIPNMARRLLEMFLAFQQPQVSGGLWNKMQHVEFDEVKKVRIMRFLDTHSHGDLVGESGYDTSLLAETPSVLQDLLELIKAQAPEHYRAMEELAKRSVGRGVDE